MTQIHTSEVRSIAWRSQQLKNEPLCDENLCPLTKAVSLIYLSLGMEGRRIFGSQEPIIQIDQISTKDLWES